MSRNISSTALRCCFILLAASRPLLAVEKAAKESPSEAKARQDVKAALKAEAAGDNDRRTELLNSAVGMAPKLAEANWHLAKVRIGQEWMILPDAEQRASSDPLLAEYRKLRDEAGDNPKLIRGLARWCLKNGWADTGRLHYAQLLARKNIDEETISEAITRMDLHYVGGKWMTGEDVKAHDERARAVDVALRKWRPRLKHIQTIIDGDEYGARQRAIKELQAIDDPQAIMAIESFLLDGGDRFCEEAARSLAKFPQFEATEALLRFAVLSPFSGARDAAIAGLKDRPKHDYMPQLIEGLVSPIKFEFSIAVDPRGTVQYKHSLSREDRDTRVVDQRDVAVTPALWQRRRQIFQPVRNAGNRLDFVLAMVSSTQDAAQEMQSRADIVNQQAAANNRRIFAALESLADAQIARDVNEWQKWWEDYNQYYWPKQTCYAYQRGAVPYMVGYGMSCFLAGTLVRTEAGLAPIESLRPGDRVLAQDQETGELAYKVALRTTVRPPAKMIRITTGKHEVVSTLGHPFWVDGHGWKMAKEMTTGDLLHSLGGAMSIDKLEPAGEEKAYNLVVDDFNTYFVGPQGLLVHDNQFRKPTRAIVPGLVEDAAVAAKK